MSLGVILKIFSNAPYTSVCLNGAKVMKHPHLYTEHTNTCCK